MKYRRLTIEELNGLEKEFIDFLVINGIEAKEWESIKDEKSEHAEKIIEAFSDVVFESIMIKTQFLDFVSSTSLLSFQCLEDRVILMGMESKDKRIDFTRSDFLERLKRGECLKYIKVIKHEKPYNDNREKELFHMIETGCHISDGSWFKAIALLSVDS